MARRRYAVGKKAAPRKTARQKATVSITSIFNLAGKRHTSKSRYRTVGAAIRDQTDMHWWGKKRGR